jgi:hypothetical protein
LFPHGWDGPLWCIKGFDAPLSVTGGSINLARDFTPWGPGRFRAEISSDSHFGSTEVRTPSKSTIHCESTSVPLSLIPTIGRATRRIRFLYANDQTRSCIRCQEDGNEHVHLLARARRFMACHTPDQRPNQRPNNLLITL